MVQTLFLMKPVGSADLLHRLQAEGVLRASAAVMGGCYSAFGLAEGPMTMVATSGALDTCNFPSETDCTPAELLGWTLSKVSYRETLPNIVFALVTVLGGKQGDYERFVTERAEQVGSAYVAAGALIGCGPHNALVEVMSDDAEEMLRLVQSLTDFDGVVDVRILRVHPDMTQGFGSSQASAG